MIETSYAKGVAAGDLRILLNFWPSFFAKYESTQQDMQADKDFPADVAAFTWCYLYELPIREHLTLALTNSAQNLNDFLSVEQLGNWFGQLKTAPSQVGEIPVVVSRISEHFNTLPDLDEAQTQKLQPSLATLLGINLSIFNTLRCVLYHGCFLNELIERVRSNDDAALLAAVRMDATVIGCPSVVQRISKASILNEEEFFNDLKNAINGKQTKREQGNFQMMRLVLEVLHEAGANRLSDAQLNQLFVEELDLYSGNAKGGGCAKALRKFADTYMKKNATT